MRPVMLLMVLGLLLAGCTQPSSPGQTTSPEQATPPDAQPIQQNPVPPQTEQGSQQAPSLNTAQPELPPEPAQSLVNGKTLEERLQEARDRLHTYGSGPQIRRDFPDVEVVYTDAAVSTGFPAQILPFRYHYSKEANTTFNICNVDLTVFICKGRLYRLISKNDIESGQCEVTPIYRSDPRLGLSGGYPGAYTYPYPG